MSVQSEIDRARGALLGTFVGDALGMPFEGAASAQIPARLTMLDARLGCGTYTDDTQMMIALAESLLDCEGVDAEALGRAFVDAHDPRRGYGAGTTEVLRVVRSRCTHTLRRDRCSVARGRRAMGRRCASRRWPCATPTT